MPHRTPEELRAQVMQLQEELEEIAAARQAEAEAARSASRRVSFLEAMMETVPVGMAIADAKGRIIHGNSRNEALIGRSVVRLSPDPEKGDFVSYHPDGRRVEAAEYPLARVIEEGVDRAELEIQFERERDRRVWLRVVSEPVRNESGELIGATVATIDIDELRRLQETQELLIAELNHRVKNAFSVVKSIVSQSLRGLDGAEALRHTLDARLDAYSGAHAKLVGGQWEKAALRAVAADVTGPIGGERIVLDGPEITLPSRQALAFSMAFYELATNAVKYGALSVPDGSASLSWWIEDDAARLAMRWCERGGPPPAPPARSGFGSFITGRALAAETRGEVTTSFEPEGFVWTITMPLPRGAETKETAR